MAYRFYCPDFAGTIEAETIREAMDSLGKRLSDRQRSLTAYSGDLREPTHPVIHVSIGDRYPDWWTEQNGRLRSE